MEDKFYLDKVKQGDESAFRVLFDKYWDDLFRIAFKRLQCEGDAGDVVQEVFLGIWQHAARIEIADTLAPYLFASLRNRIFNLYEKRTVRLRYLLARKPEPVASEDIIIGAIQNKELQAVIAAEIAAMPARMREIYRMSREGMMTVGEIADALALSHQTVKNQLHRGLERLRHSLELRHLHKFSSFL